MCNLQWISMKKKVHKIFAIFKDEQISKGILIFEPSSNKRTKIPVHQLFPFGKKLTDSDFMAGASIKGERQEGQLPPPPYFRRIEGAAGSGGAPHYNLPPPLLGSY